MQSTLLAGLMLHWAHGVPDVAGCGKLSDVFGVVVNWGLGQCGVRFSTQAWFPRMVEMARAKFGARLWAGRLWSVGSVGRGCA